MGFVSFEILITFGAGIDNLWTARLSLGVACKLWRVVWVGSDVVLFIYACMCYCDCVNVCRFTDDEVLFAGLAKYGVLVVFQRCLSVYVWGSTFWGLRLDFYFNLVWGIERFGFLKTWTCGGFGFYFILGA